MAATSAPGKRENVLTRKIGPLATWVWVAIIGGVIVVWALYERHKSSSAPAGAPGTAGNLQPPEVIQTTPPEITINDDDRDKSTDHHRRHAVRVPDVIGDQYEAGSKEIAKAGLTAQRSSPFVGTVTRESPSAGSHVARGTVVTLSGSPWPRTQFPQPKGGPKGGPPARRGPVRKKRRHGGGGVNHPQ